MNPDCRAGKHHACSGTAWDEDRDELGTCSCTCHRPGSFGRVTPTGRVVTDPPTGTTPVTGL